MVCKVLIAWSQHLTPLSSCVAICKMEMPFKEEEPQGPGLKEPFLCSQWILGSDNMTYVLNYKSEQWISEDTQDVVQFFAA